MQSSAFVLNRVIHIEEGLVYIKLIRLKREVLVIFLKEVIKTIALNKPLLQILKMFYSAFCNSVYMLQSTRQRNQPQRLGHGTLVVCNITDSYNLSLWYPGCNGDCSLMSMSSQYSQLILQVVPNIQGLNLKFSTFDSVNAL